MKFSRVYLLLLIFWLILAGLIVWFKVVPLGRATYYINYPVKINIFGGKGFIGNLTPAERVNNLPGQLPEIIGDPVYFSIFTPRTFNKAKITITYQDLLSQDTPIIEAGVLVDNIVWRYQLASLENKILDSNFINWNRIQKDGNLLLQKNNDFLEMADFLTSLKDQSKNICGDKENNNCVALYNTTVNSRFDFKKNSEFTAWEIPLQGAHQFYFTAPNDKNLDFSFDFTDLNLDKKSDPVIISIYQEDNKIYSTTTVDNLSGEGSGVVRNFKASFSYKANIQETIKNILYKLEIKASDDLVIKKITKAPSALNAVGRLHPVAVSDTPLSFWTDSSFIKLTTNNPASRQLIKFGNQSFSLAEPYQQYEFSSNKNGVKEIVLNKDDVILETDGVFSLSAVTFFNPDFKKVDEHFVLDDNLKYVLASYQTPIILDDNLKQASVILDTKEAYREKGKYSFMISVPGLSLNNQGNVKQNSLLIKSIKVEFLGRTILDKFKEYVN